ncbi:MAG: hypothetical protein HY868_20210 [Chloroflexi bacterium]|nr:hypothetical protein [Chloroflexota bacterium]
MQPVMVEIIAYAPTQYFHCKHCEFVWSQAQSEGVKKFHADALETSMPPEMMTEYRALSDWVLNAVERYGGRVVFKVIDATSFEGLIKSVRYGVRKYPAVVISGKDKHIGADFAGAEAMINRALQPA